MKNNEEICMENLTICVYTIAISLICICIFNNGTAEYLFCGSLQFSLFPVV